MRYDKRKLWTMDKVLAYLRKHGSSDRELDEIRDKLARRLKVDPAWRYPVSDGFNAGGVILPVEEGYLFLPYNEMDREDYEIYDLDRAYLLDQDAIGYLLDEFRSYADALCEEMRLIATDLCETPVEAV